MGSLISAAELRDALAEVTVLDVRYRMGRDDGYEQYLAGHVPTAAYVDLDNDLADPPGDPVDTRGRHPLPQADRFAAAMRRRGVHRERTVVVYDDWDARAATRAWWLLVHHGHPDARVLDGGWPAWTRDGGAVETGEPAVAPGDFRGGPGRLPVVDADGAARVAREGVLLDARAPERFRGETEPVDPVAGHIPGAANVPTSSNLHDGRFRSPADLAEIYATAEGAREVAAYCGSGVTATHDVFAMHLLGRQAALYAGSWSGWVADPARPTSAHP
jgi:thiosulfate/3-mercaptopyruvate sulfurtransferase